MKDYKKLAKDFIEKNNWEYSDQSMGIYDFARKLSQQDTECGHNLGCKHNPDCSQCLAERQARMSKISPTKSPVEPIKELNYKDTDLMIGSNGSYEVKANFNLVNKINEIIVVINRLNKK